MKKIIAIISVIVVIFVAIAVITNMQQSAKIKDNPYGKDQLRADTIKLLEDPNYQNIIVPGELEEKLQSGEPTTVYFFAPDCQYCLMTTPILVPLADEMGVDVGLYNLREFQQGWDQFRITATPTVIHFVNGQEVNRMEGYQEEPTFRGWLEEIR